MVITGYDLFEALNEDCLYSNTSSVASLIKYLCKANNIYFKFYITRDLFHEYGEISRNPKNNHDFIAAGVQFKKKFKLFFDLWSRNINPSESFYITSQDIKAFNQAAILEIEKKSTIYYELLSFLIFLIFYSQDKDTQSKYAPENNLPNIFLRHSIQPILDNHQFSITDVNNIFSLNKMPLISAFAPNDIYNSYNFNEYCNSLPKTINDYYEDLPIYIKSFYVKTGKIDKSKAINVLSSKIKPKLPTRIANELSKYVDINSSEYEFYLDKNQWICTFNFDSMPYSRYKYIPVIHFLISNPYKHFTAYELLGQIHKDLNSKQGVVNIDANTLKTFVKTKHDFKYIEFEQLQESVRKYILEIEKELSSGEIGPEEYNIKIENLKQSLEIHDSGNKLPQPNSLKNMKLALTVGIERELSRINEFQPALYRHLEHIVNERTTFKGRLATFCYKPEKMLSWRLAK